MLSAIDSWLTLCNTVFRTYYKEDRQQILRLQVNPGVGQGLKEEEEGVHALDRITRRASMKAAQGQL
ncbi:hypothetical protein B9Q07_04540 [Candidatus Marsarchaeota G2 archaeon ECH_B_3]|uniref:Uncharacterized protein n=2 Tax=Candidatus Marsarchaeota group 2 TaxID=2203771 RepID=A0A2R6BVL5_9ARCH|nr:MAG: hypothetical protein B9Q07_04540 [Candidatus Marsarchaeota G2 archaeon ECH_B_3]PSO02690.1 MAG: hypothetical protein B9Q05_04070 [Candidatus Marsarchaeota G2 archaeon ECH_B_1]